MPAMAIPLHQGETGRSVRPARRGRPSAADDAALDMAFHVSEEQEQAATARPLIGRLYVIAQDYGPAAMQTVRALDHWHVRHARRWGPEEAA